MREKLLLQHGVNRPCNGNFKKNGDVYLPLIDNVNLNQKLENWQPEILIWKRLYGKKNETQFKQTSVCKFPESNEHLAT